MPMQLTCIWWIRESHALIPFPNSPFKNGQKHSTNHTLHKTSPDPLPSLALVFAALTSLQPALLSGPVKWLCLEQKLGTRRRSTYRHQQHEHGAPSLEVNLSSKTVSDIPKSLSMTPRNPNNYAFIAVILAILWLFHQARTGRPVLRYSGRVYRL
jgi:hypothetical protein|uniref:Uncharacterized protein n=1 Tax=Fagus sylvatica TaxID=28930 RepID=A0A2N9J4H6_FAGSY